MRISIFDYDNSLKVTNARPPTSWVGPISSADRSRNSAWEAQPASIRRIGKDDNVWNESVIAAVKDRVADPFTVAVLMTARDMHASEIVINDLDTVGICFDAYIFDEKVPKLDSDLNVVYKDDRVPVMIDTSPELYKQAMTLAIACWMNTGEFLFPEFEKHTHDLPLSGVDEIEIFDDNVDNIEAVAAIAAKLGITFTGHLIEIAHRDAMNEGWRNAGDPPLQGDFNAGAPKKKRAPKDATYGSEPDLLDKPGVIVEPVVRKKISDYFTKMKLREMIKTIMSDNA